MFESISRSFGIVKKSFGVLMDEKKLLIFPIISAIAILVVLISFAVPIFLVNNQILLILLLFCFYFFSYFVVIFFNSALIHAVNEKLEGRPVSLAGSVAFTISRAPNIILWAGISATVGLILNMLRDMARNGKGIGAIIGGIMVSLLGMAWSIATFFVVPVIVFENVNPFTAFGRSVEIVKKTWSEQILGGFAIGMVFLVAYLVGIVLIIGGVLVIPLVFVLVPLGLMIMFMAFIAQGAVEGIFLAELYRYSKSGQSAIFKQEIEEARGSLVKPPTAGNP
jgi:hypothetical protein